MKKYKEQITNLKSILYDVTVILCFISGFVLFVVGLVYGGTSQTATVQLSVLGNIQMPFPQLSILGIFLIGLGLIYGKEKGDKNK